MSSSARIGIALFLAAIGVVVAVAHAATVYRSVGPDGQTVYSDQPPADARKAKKLEFADLPATPLPDSVLKYRDELQKSMKKRLAEGAQLPSGTVLFSAKWCGYCTQAKAYLGEKRIPYQEHDIDTPDGMRAYVAAGNSRGVPVLLYKSEKVQGFSRAAYDSLFGSGR
jgi:glutaredoxin